MADCPAAVVDELAVERSAAPPEEVAEAVGSPVVDELAEVAADR